MSVKFQILMTEKASTLLLISILFWLPIYRGGNASSAVALLFLCSATILVLAIFTSEGLTVKRWVAVWVVVSCSVFCRELPIFTNMSYGNAIFPLNGVNLESLYVWGFFSSMWVVCWRVSLLTWPQISWLMLALFCASSFQALYGLIHLFTGAEQILGLWTKKHYLADATGTFINRNHFSGMLAMSWPIVVVALCANPTALLSNLNFSARLGISVIYSVIIIAALIASHSRMGFAAAVFGAIVCLMIWRKSLVSMVGLAKHLPLAVSVGFILFGIWFGVEDIALRYATLESGDSRLDVWAAMFDLPFQAWLIGIGPGSFEDVFHLIQPYYLTKTFAYAHNDYLQFALEFGIVWVIFIVVFIVLLVSKEMPRGRFYSRAGAMGALAAIALHSTVDSMIQIPGSALVAWIALGLLMNRNFVNLDVAENYEKNSIQSKKAKRRIRKMPFPRTKREWLEFFRPD